MTNNENEAVTLWQNFAMPKFQSLQENLVTDVCIVGAGITGLTTAYLLAREGTEVVVLDDGPVGGGESMRTSAHLSNVLGERYFVLEQLHGKEGAEKIVASHSAAIKKIYEIAEIENIACDFEWVNGYLFLNEGQPLRILHQELEAASSAGLLVSYLDETPRPCTHAASLGPCLAFKKQAQFHPAKYIAGLTAALLRLGVKIYTSTHVNEVKGGEEAFVKTEDGCTVYAQDIVMATNVPINNLFKIHTKQFAYRSYAISMSIKSADLTPALYWDTADPYHYLRFIKSAESEDHHLIVGGEDHKTGQAKENILVFERLEKWARERLPMAGPVMQHWSGQIMEPLDGIAYIGRNSSEENNIYIATGDAGNGLTHGTIAALINSDLILGNFNPWASLYDPARTNMRLAGTYINENVNAIAQYSDWLSPGDVETCDHIPTDEGAVVRQGLHKVAVYRDQKGELHTCSAVCPHLGGIVHWNGEEKSWDCPCHGSRFDRYGKVMNGPAISSLAPATSILHNPPAQRIHSPNLSST